MPGKWTGLRGAVPPAPVDMDQQQKIELVKHGFLNLSKPERGAEYCRLRDDKEQLENQIKQINLGLEALSQIMIKEMEAEGTDMFRLASGDSLSIKDEPYVSVAERDQFMQWIRESGQESLLTVNYMTMSSMVKERLSTGQNAPPGLKVYIRQSITRRKGRS